MKVQIVLGSVRDGRLGSRVAQWVIGRAQMQSGWEVELVDLKDYADLPAFSSGTHPMMRQEPYANPVANRWSDKLAEADGYVFVFPEYNYSISGAFKNALDYLYHELSGKPAALVSYSGVMTGGVRAAAHLQNSLPNQGLFLAPTRVAISQASSVIDESGELNKELATSPTGPNSTLDKELAELDRLLAAAHLPAKAV